MTAINHRLDPETFGKLYDYTHQDSHVSTVEVTNILKSRRIAYYAAIQDTKDMDWLDLSTDLRTLNWEYKNTWLIQAAKMVDINIMPEATSGLDSIIYVPVDLFYKLLSWANNASLESLAKLFGLNFNLNTDSVEFTSQSRKSGLIIGNKLGVYPSIWDKSLIITETNTPEDWKGLIELNSGVKKIMQSHVAESTTYEGIRIDKNIEGIEGKRSTVEWYDKVWRVKQNGNFQDILRREIPITISQLHDLANQKSWSQQSIQNTLELVFSLLPQERFNYQ